MQCVRRVRQAGQDARIDEYGHYSYIPSLVSASAGSDTP
jgi:hypothetical protein